jgi:uncharacterized OsmC-like protein
MSITSSVVYKGELRTLCTHLESGKQLFTDAPLDNHGKGEAFSPTDLLATSLAACMLTVMGIKARDMNIDMKGTKAEEEEEDDETVKEDETIKSTPSSTSSSEESSDRPSETS